MALWPSGMPFAVVMRVSLLNVPACLNGMAGGPVPFSVVTEASENRHGGFTRST